MYWKAIHLYAKTPYFDVETHLVPHRWLHGCGEGQRTPQGINFPCHEKQGRSCTNRHSGGLRVMEGTKTGPEQVVRMPITKALATAFRAHKAAHDKELAAAKKARRFDPLKSEHEGLVITRPKTGGALSPTNDNKAFVRLLREAEITRHYRVYDLRHTSITRMI